MNARSRPFRRPMRSRHASVASSAEILRAAMAAASSVSVSSVTRRARLQHDGEVRRLLAEREVARHALDGAGEGGHLSLHVARRGSAPVLRSLSHRGGILTGRAGREPPGPLDEESYFFSGFFSAEAAGFAAVVCLAITWSLILAYVASGTIFFFTSSSLRAYGRPSTIF